MPIFTQPDAELLEFNWCHSPENGQFCSAPDAGSGGGPSGESSGPKFTWGTPVKGDGTGRMLDLRNQLVKGELVIGQWYNSAGPSMVIEFGRVKKILKGAVDIERPDGTSVRLTSKVATYQREGEKATAEEIWQQARLASGYVETRPLGLRKPAGIGRVDEPVSDEVAYRRTQNLIRRSKAKRRDRMAKRALARRARGE